MNAAPHHYYEETPEERLEREIEFYKTLKEDDSGRLHDEWGRFASEKESPEGSASSTWQALKEWGELLGLASIRYRPKKPGETFGVYVPYIHIGKTTYFVLGFAAFEVLRKII